MVERPAPSQPNAALLRQLLAARRGRQPLARLGDGERVQSLDEAYATAFALVSELGMTPAGAKIGANGPAGQRALGLAAPLWGHTLAERTWLVEASFEAPPRGVVAEAEWVLTLGRDLDGDAARDPEAVRDAVAEAALGIEINEPSYLDPIGEGGLAIIADNGVHAGLLVGRPAPLDLQALLHDPLWLQVDNQPRRLAEAAQMGIDPLAALGWLAADRAARGQPLRSGHRIATGAIISVQGLHAGQRISVGRAMNAESPECTLVLT